MKRLAVLLLSLTLTAAAQSAPAHLYWTGSWASAQMRPDGRDYSSSTALTNVTMREIVHLSLGGPEVRVRFSNVFGKAPLRISSVHIADAVSPSSSQIKPSTDKAVTFAGKTSVMIPPGAAYFSDPVKLNAKPLSNLAITFHIKTPPMPATYHGNSNQTTFIVHGNHTTATKLTNARTVGHWYWLSGIDVASSHPRRCVVAFGDSITDGWMSTVNGNNRWPDDLARRLQANPATRNVGVLNEGISGNRVVMNGWGPNGMSRLDRDVFSQDGVKYLIVLEGINDIGHLEMEGHVTPADIHALKEHLIDAYKQIIAQAHAHGIKVIGGTLKPYAGPVYYKKAHAPEFEEMLRQINAWIRAPGHFDAYVDFNKVTRDPANPNRFAPGLGARGHLHPNPKGYQVMANAINLKWFEKK